MNNPYLDHLVDMMEQITQSMPRPIEPVKLTDEQIASLPRASNPYGLDSLNLLSGVPIVRVERVEESTPYLLRHGQPAPPTRWSRVRAWFGRWLA